MFPASQTFSEVRQFTFDSVAWKTPCPGQGILGPSFREETREETYASREPGHQALSCIAFIR